MALEMMFEALGLHDSWDHIRRAAGGCARGGSAERFETPLAGGAAASMPASVLCWRAACAAWGEPARPGFPPEGETGKGESKFLAAAGDFLCHPLLGRFVGQLLDAALAFVEDS